MRYIISTCLSLLTVILCLGQSIDNYHTLDKKNTIHFNEDFIIYHNDTIELGPLSFFIDGQLTDEETANRPYVFNSVNEAAEHLTNGTEASPMTLYLAPYVYWIDDPDDPEVRTPKEGDRSPYGLIIACEWLKFYGLSDDPINVVLASNRGQTIGAEGNFTMFKFIGDGTCSENITFGNYCNIDLEFPLKPSLNRKKRASAIVQAQLIHCNGDKIVARNTRFVSRLNLCPFVGGKRILFDKCHFESTDDALSGTAVYLNSTLDFYSSKPFYRTTGTGALFLNCDIHLYTSNNQYFTKANGQVGVVDTRFEGKEEPYLGWKDLPPHEMRNYQYNISYNGHPAFIGKKDTALTVDMSGKKILDAYRFIQQDKVIYNTYNLLRGNDDWDPMGIKPLVMEAEKNQKKKLSMLPVQLSITPTRVSIETGKDQTQLTAKVSRFGNYESSGQTVKWTIAPEYSSFVQLSVSDDSLSCNVIPTNATNEVMEVIVTASTLSGLEAASVLDVAPAKLEAPQFLKFPKITKTTNGKLVVDYKLNMAFADQSLVTWYRCTDAKGSNPIEVAVSRFDRPLLEYELSAGDIGYYLMVSVAPKHLRSDPGQPASFAMKKPISNRDVKSDPKVLYTDFKNIATSNQPKVMPGFWTMDYPAIEPENRSEKDAWYYGTGRDGAANIQGLLQGRNASLFYTPVGNEFKDMKLKMTVAPFKSAGQGFSVAHLYMDLLIKFDASTMTGYGLRFIRTTKYGDAVDCLFVKYDYGKITEISGPISTSVYNTPCHITLELKDNKLIATADRPGAGYNKPGIADKIRMETKIPVNTYGGFGIQYNGGASAVIEEVKVVWQ